MRCSLLTVFISFFTCISANPQSDSYILKRETYRTPLSSINLSPDGKFLLAGFRDGSFRLLDSGTFQEIREVQEAHLKAVNAIDMPSKMNRILTAGHNTIKLWDLQGNRTDILSGHATTIWNAEISPGGRYAVSSAFNKTFLLWDLDTKEPPWQMRGHDDVVLAVGFSPDGRLIASAGNDHSVNIWDRNSRQIVRTLHGPTGDVYDVEFSPGSRMLAVASKDRSVRIYDLQEAGLLHVLKGHRDMVTEVEFSPDGRYLVSGSADQALILWDAGNGEKIHSYLDNEEAVLDLVFHPDGQTFCSISFAADLTCWEIHPEIFALRYYKESYRKELESDPLFETRRKGESRKDFQARQEEAATRKREIARRFYLRYLEARD